jgi:hypothetical protein
MPFHVVADGSQNHVDVPLSKRVIQLSHHLDIRVLVHMSLRVAGLPGLVGDRLRQVSADDHVANM